MPCLNQLYSENVQPIDYNSILSGKNLYAPTADQVGDVLSMEQDYIDLFSFKRKGHMTKYIHMYRPDIYDTVIQQNSFYPFKMECALLEQKIDEIISSFLEIREVVEVGPGSKVPVMSKTIPLLKRLQQKSCIEVYTAMDINPTYAQQACQIVQEQFPNITTKAIEIDFLSKQQLINVLDHFQNGAKKLIFGFGQSIVSNNTDEDTQKFLDNIAMLLTKEDDLLFGVDTNKDEETLKIAYNTDLFHKLLLNTMYYLKYRLHLTNFNPEMFELVCKWDPKKNIVSLLLRATCQQVIFIRNERLIIHTGQEFHISSSRKPDLKKIGKFLARASLKIKDIVSLCHQKENKFSMIITQKI